MIGNIFFHMERVLTNSTTCTKFIGYRLKWLATCNKRVKIIKELTPVKKAITPLKQAIKELTWEGEDLHEGPLIDLAVLLSKIVRTYEHKGIYYTLEKYVLELIKT